MAEFSDDELVLDAADSEQEAGDAEEEFETDPKRLVARQKQIDYGKNTIGYENYLKAVPKERRKKFGRDHDPPTPDITKKYSKKSWDGIVKAWRRHLHKFDYYKPNERPAVTPAEQAAEANVNMQQDGDITTEAADPDSAQRNTRQRKTAAGEQQHRRQADDPQQQQQHRYGSARVTGRGSHASSRSNGREGSPGYQHNSSRYHERTRGHGLNREEHWQQQPSGSSRYDSRYRDWERQDDNNHTPQGDREDRDYSSHSYNHTCGSNRYQPQQHSNSRTPGGYNSSRRDATRLGYHSSSRAEGSRRGRDHDIERENRMQQQQQHEQTQKTSQQRGAEAAGMSWADEVDEAEAAGQISIREDKANHGNGGYAGGGGSGDGGSSAAQGKRSEKGSSHQQLTPAKRSSNQSHSARRPLKPFQ